ncbi:hypothetical protein SODG_005634 [Sodalis praecaptivus]
MSRVPDAGVEDVRSAIDAAERAQEAWEELPAQERGVWLHKIAAGIRAREKALTDIIIAEGVKLAPWPIPKCYLPPTIWIIWRSGRGAMKGNRAKRQAR